MGIPLRITADLPRETFQARREWQDILKVMKEKNLQPRLLYPAKISFKYEPIILPFHTVHGVLKARILKWFAIPFSSGPHSVRRLHHDPSVLGGPKRHGLISLS